MDNFHIKGQDYIPEVYFDAQKHQLHISGESYHEYTVEFYQPVFEWLEQYLKDGGKHITMEFKMSYFNTSTSRRFLEILHLLEEYQLNNNGKVTINWFYEEDDMDMLETGEEYEVEVEIPFNLIPYIPEEE